MKILLFKVGALGDLLMTTPLARQLRKTFPDARIEYLAGEGFAGILRGNPSIDEVVAFPEDVFYRRDLPGVLGLARRIRKRRYDAVFVLDRHWVFPLAAFLFGIPKRIGFDRLGKEGILLTDKVRFEAVRHEVHYYLDLLGRIAEPDYSDARMDFFPSEADVAFADGFWMGHGLAGKKVVCLAPGGGVNPGQALLLKRWPVEHYAALALLLKREGFEVVLVGGASDRPLEKEIAARADVHSGVGAALGQSAELLRRGHAIVCSDGGPMHLAAAVNDRVISIFGPTDPRRLAPLNGLRYLWNPGKCAPCYDVYGRIRVCSEDYACMRSVTPSDVLDIVRKADIS